MFEPELKVLGLCVLQEPQLQLTSTWQAPSMTECIMNWLSSWVVEALMKLGFENPCRRSRCPDRWQSRLVRTQSPCFHTRHSCCSSISCVGCRLTCVMPVCSCLLMAQVTRVPLPAAREAQPPAVHNTSVRQYLRPDTCCTGSRRSVCLHASAYNATVNNSTQLTGSPPAHL